MKIKRRKRPLAQEENAPMVRRRIKKKKKSKATCRLCDYWRHGEPVRVGKELIGRNCSVCKKDREAKHKACENFSLVKYIPCEKYDEIIDLPLCLVRAENPRQTKRGKKLFPFCETCPTHAMAKQLIPMEEQKVISARVAEMQAVYEQKEEERRIKARHAMADAKKRQSASLLLKYMPSAFEPAEEHPMVKRRRRPMEKNVHVEKLRVKRRPRKFAIDKKNKTIEIRNIKRRKRIVFA